MSIQGNTVGTTVPRPDWAQTDPKNAAYIRNKEAVNNHINSKENPHGVTPAQIGAAPAGYGLGSNSKSTSNVDIDNLVENGFYSTNNSTINTPAAGIGYLFVVNRTTSDYVTQIYFVYGLSNKVLIRTRDYYGNWSAWEDWSPSSFAKAGHIDAIKYVSSNEEIYAAVQELANTTSDNIVHAIFSVSKTGLELPGGTVFVDIYGSSGSWYTAKAYYYGYTAGSATEYIGSGYNGVFSGFDCLNPPLIPGVEYRTTERWNCKPVYVKYTTDFGALPNNSFKSLWIADGITDLVRIDGRCRHTDGDLIPITPTPNLIASVKLIGTNLRIDTCADASSWVCLPIVYYCKD